MQDSWTRTIYSKSDEHLEGVRAKPETALAKRNDHECVTVQTRRKRKHDEEKTRCLKFRLYQVPLRRIQENQQRMASVDIEEKNL